MNKHCTLKFIPLSLFLLGLLTESAQAYIGPGAGLSAIGALLAVIAAVIVALFGFIWYPVKRLLRKFKKNKRAEEAEDGRKTEIT